MKQTQFLTTVKINDGVLLFNALNGALVKLNSEEHDEMRRFISNKEEITPKSRLIDELILMEMVVDDSRDEVSELEQQFWSFRNSAEYIKVVLAPTSACNFSCIYCFEKGNCSSSMSNITVQKIVKQIKNKLITNMSKGLVLIWYGGEPLMEWNIVQDITSTLYHFCRDLEIKFDSCIVSNGYFLSEKRICKLKEIGCSTIQITLDGDDATHDTRRPLKNGGATFQKIYENIALCSNKLRTCVRINVDRGNVESTKILIDKLSRDKLTNLYLSFARTKSFNNYNAALCYSQEAFAHVEIELLTYAMMAGMKECVALPNPNLGFCEALCKHSLLFDPDGDNFFCWENVGRKELTNCDTCDHSQYANLKDFFENTYSFFDEKCKHCSILPVCLGGCPQRKLETGMVQCPPLLYNIEEKIALYYSEHYQMESC